MDEINLCPGCNTMKHLGTDGLCGRCSPPESEIDAILETLVKNFASLEEDSDGLYWWGHDTNLGDQSEAFDEAIAAILALLPEKQEAIDGLNKDMILGRNITIDQTRRNLIGEQHG